MNVIINSLVTFSLQWFQVAVFWRVTMFQLFIDSLIAKLNVLNTALEVIVAELQLILLRRIFIFFNITFHQ